MFNVFKHCVCRFCIATSWWSCSVSSMIKTVITCKIIMLGVKIKCLKKLFTFNIFFTENHTSFFTCVAAKYFSDMLKLIYVYSYTITKKLVTFHWQIMKIEWYFQNSNKIQCWAFLHPSLCKCLVTYPIVSRTTWIFISYCTTCNKISAKYCNQSFGVFYSGYLGVHLLK